MTLRRNLRNVRRRPQPASNGKLPLGPLLMRVFAGLAALFLVGAAVLASTGPDGLSLADAVSVVDVMAVFRLQEFALRHWPHWVWGQMAMPWLLRPAWLLPACLGIVCAGVAGSLMGGAPPKRRR